ncbi:hypothetical protein FOXB_04629 [Fusarium oxysporum f. sp. conglutinans Fo5176]|uniref:Uncharacterized protein n=1 Tax=Fusarium oxysporum (strain Fo5176) TaxID=660025 RepID=F9FE01_FUSOF|nr:hypothetical protein FOXB_04629 [Fusarium oxysporum f. sp. conglutinans Fo5176]
MQTVISGRQQSAVQSHRASEDEHHDIEHEPLRSLRQTRRPLEKDLSRHR